MSNTSYLAFIIGGFMMFLTLINVLTTNIFTPAIQRAETISGLSSVTILLVGFLLQKVEPKQKTKTQLKGIKGFFIQDNLDTDLKNEIGWGSQMILTATATATVLLYYKKKTIFKRGLISECQFEPGEICNTSTIKKKYISLVSTKFYPGKKEFDNILKDLPSVIVFPLNKDGWLIIGGWSERCYTKSDEIWIDGWSKKITGLMEMKY